MGYSVQVLESQLRFKPGTDPVALGQHIKEVMFTPEAIKKHGRGGSFGGGGQTEWWYSWVTTKDALAAADVFEIIKLFVDDVQQDPGSWQIFMDSKSGQEEVLFEHLAPFIEAGGTVVWEGEDGERWRWYFDGTTMRNQAANVTWDTWED